MTSPPNPEKAPGRSHAMRWLGLTLILILLITAAPTIVSFAAVGIGSALDCPGIMEVSAPCMFLGSDISGTLTLMIFMGYFAFVTIPFGEFLLLIWAIVACVVAVLRWRQRRHAA
jgi:hypothetical protein